jgi:hypothetical protein
MSAMSLDSLTTELQRIDRVRRADPMKAIEAVAGLAAQLKALIATLAPSKTNQVANDNTADSVAPAVDHATEGGAAGEAGQPDGIY